MVERSKGQTWNEDVVFRKRLVSQRSDIPTLSNLLVDFTVKTGLVYTAPLDRSFAANQSVELSTVTDFYVGWFWDFCHI